MQNKSMNFKSYYIFTLIFILFSLLIFLSLLVSRKRSISYVPQFKHSMEELNRSIDEITSRGWGKDIKVYFEYVRSNLWFFSEFSG